MDKTRVNQPLPGAHYFSLPGTMNVPSMFPQHMAVMPPLASGPWHPWQMPYMNMPAMTPFMTPLPNMLNSTVELMKHNMGLFHQKADLMGIAPLPEHHGTQSESYIQRRNLVKNGFSKEYPHRRKSLPSEHELCPDFDDALQDTDKYSSSHTPEANQRPQWDMSSTDALSKNADEGYASYQKTSSRDSQGGSNSNKKKSALNKLEQYTKSPPMRRKSLPDPHEIVSVSRDSDSGGAAVMAAHSSRVNRSTPAFQSSSSQYRDARWYTGPAAHKPGKLDASLYSIDTSEDDNGSFVSSLEGDQVLEWNGIPLTGKTYEDVQSIISQPNGEIELVVRPGADMTGKSATMSTLRSESCHSSYDNLDFASDYDDYERYLEPQQGVDPSLLAAQLEGIQQKQQQQQPPTPHQGRHQKGPAPDRPAQHIQDGRRDAAPPRRQQQQPQVLQQQQQQQRQQQQQHVPREREPARGRGRQARMSPGISPTSSQPENLATPNMSTPLSSPPSPRTEMANQINEQIIAQQNEELPPDEVPTKEPAKRDQFGRIQLHLSYDDYDGSLNVVVISAHGLQAKDKNGYSDPFARVELLPGRMNREDIQETKTIIKTLDPEWNEALVFLNLPRDEFMRQKLKLTLWDYDRYKSDDFMGELILHLSDTSYLSSTPQWYNLYDEGECDKSGPVRPLLSPVTSPRLEARRAAQRRDQSPPKQPPFIDQQQNKQKTNRSGSPSRRQPPVPQPARQLPAVGEPGDSSSSSDRPPPREHQRGRDVSPNRRPRSREPSRGRDQPGSRETSRGREPIGRESSPPSRHKSRERNQNQQFREGDGPAPLDGRPERESPPPGQKPRSRRGSRDQREASPTRQRPEGPAERRGGGSPPGTRCSKSPHRRGPRDGSPPRRRRGSRESLEGRGPDRPRNRSRESSPGRERERKPSRGREMPVPPGGDRPRDPRGPRDPRDRGPRDRREPRDPRGRGRESPSGRGRDSPGGHRGHGPRGPRREGEHPRERRDRDGDHRGRESPGQGPHPRRRNGRDSPGQRGASREGDPPRGRESPGQGAYPPGRESPPSSERDRDSPRGAPQGQSGDERPPPPQADQQLQQQQPPLHGALPRDQPQDPRSRMDQPYDPRSRMDQPQDSRSRMDQPQDPRSRMDQPQDPRARMDQQPDPGSRIDQPDPRLEHRDPRMDQQYDPRMDHDPRTRMDQHDPRGRMDDGELPPPPRDDQRPYDQGPGPQPPGVEDDRRGGPPGQQDWRNQDWRDRERERDQPAAGRGGPGVDNRPPEERGRPELTRQDSKEGGKPKPPSQGGVLRDPSTGRVVDLTKPPSQGGVIRDPISGKEISLPSGGIGISGVMGRESPFTRSLSQESSTSTGEGPARGSPVIAKPAGVAQPRAAGGPAAPAAAAGRGRGAAPSSARKPPQPEPPQQERCKIKMGLSALSSPSGTDRSGERLTTDDSDEGATVWQPRPVDREAMARIARYYTEASLSAQGDMDYEEPKTRSLGFLNIASETSTEDELAAEVKQHNYEAAMSQPKLVYHNDHSHTKPAIVVDFRPIEPMPTSPSSGKPRGKPLGVSPSRSLDTLPKITSKTDNFIQEARELYSSHFGANVTEEDRRRSPRQPEYFKQEYTRYIPHVQHEDKFSFRKPYKASSKAYKMDQQQQEPTADKYKHKLRPTLQTPPFPTDLSIDRKLSVYNGPATYVDSTDHDKMFVGATRVNSSNAANSETNQTKSTPNSTIFIQRQKDLLDEKYQSEQPINTASTRREPVVHEGQQSKRHSEQSSQYEFGANTDIPQQTTLVEPLAFRPVYVEPSPHSSSKTSAEQKKKDFSCCSLGRDPKQSMPTQPQQEDNTQDTTSSVSVPGSPNKRRHSRHYRSNSTPFPSPCNFIDLLADDPTTSRDPYNYYHVTTSQPSLVNNGASFEHFAPRDVTKVVTSSSAGNLRQEPSAVSDLDLENKSATLGKQPKKPRYIKHKKSPSTHSCGAISGLTASSGSGTTLGASTGKSSETLRPEGQGGEVSLESRLQYFFKQQAAAEGFCSSRDTDLEQQMAGTNLGLGQILPNLLSPTGRGSSYMVTGELMLGLQPGIDDRSLVLNVVKAKDISDHFIDLGKKREWHCIVSCQDYKRNRTKQFRSHAIKAIYDPVFHEIFGFKINSLEGLLQVKLLCRKGIFSQKKKVGSIYLCLEKIPFENYENGELVAWYKLLRKR